MIPGTTPVLGLVSAALSGSFVSQINNIPSNVSVFGFPCSLCSFNSDKTNHVKMQEKNKNFPPDQAELMTK